MQKELKRSKSESGFIIKGIEDLFSAGFEEVVGKLFGENNGIFDGACNLLSDEICAVNIRNKSVNLQNTICNFRKGPNRSVTAALHCY